MNAGNWKNRRIAELEEEVARLKLALQNANLRVPPPPNCPYRGCAK